MANKFEVGDYFTINYPYLYGKNICKVSDIVKNLIKYEIIYSSIGNWILKDMTINSSNAQDSIILGNNLKIIRILYG